MPDKKVTFNWNGEIIDMDSWEGSPGGEFEYQTTSLRHFFRFYLQPSGHAIRIYILDSPSYRGRATDGHSTHRHYDADSQLHYICIRDDLQPETVPEALSWLIYWAEETGKYIDTGRAFS